LLLAPIFPISQGTNLERKILGQMRLYEPDSCVCTSLQSCPESAISN
jgi:hypothetical protein